MALACLGVPHIRASCTPDTVGFERQDVINPQTGVQAHLDGQRIGWHHCREYQPHGIVLDPLTSHFLPPC